MFTFYKFLENKRSWEGEQLFPNASQEPERKFPYNPKPKQQPQVDITKIEPGHFFEVPANGKNRKYLKLSNESNSFVDLTFMKYEKLRIDVEVVDLGPSNF